MAIPNLADATFEAQARLFSTDWAIVEMSAGGYNGVISGCAVTAQSPNAMAVDVASGLTKLAGAQITVAGNAVSITAANATYPRLDVIYVNSSGVAAVSTGTAAPAPVPNALPASSVGVAFVYVPAEDTAIGATQIIDKRITVAAPLGESQWTTLSKAADEARTSTTTLADDDTLYFTVAANTKYRIRGVLHIDAASSTPGFDARIVGPASPTYISSWWRAPNISTGLDSVARHETVYSASDFLLSGAGAQTGIVYLEVVLHNGANAGTFSIQWAQNVSNASATTVKAGSYLEYEVA